MGKEIYDVSFYDPEEGGYIVRQVRATSPADARDIARQDIKSRRPRAILEPRHAIPLTGGRTGKDITDMALERWHEYDKEQYLDYWEPDKYGEDMLDELKQDDPARWNMLMGLTRKGL